MSSPHHTHSDHSGHHAPDGKQVKITVLLALGMFFVMSFTGHQIFVAGQKHESPAVAHNTEHKTPEHKEPEHKNSDHKSSH